MAQSSETNALCGLLLRVRLGVEARQAHTENRAETYARKRPQILTSGHPERPITEIAASVGLSAADTAAEVDKAVEADDDEAAEGSGP